MEWPDERMPLDFDMTHPVLFATNALGIDLIRFMLQYHILNKNKRSQERVIIVLVYVEILSCDYFWNHQIRRASKKASEINTNYLGAVYIIHNIMNKQLATAPKR